MFEKKKKKKMMIKVIVNGGHVFLSSVGDFR